jgi:hypothetical protein
LVAQNIFVVETSAAWCMCFYQKAWSGVPNPDSIKAPVERQQLEFPLIKFPKNSPLFFARYHHVSSQAKLLYFF